MWASQQGTAGHRVSQALTARAPPCAATPTSPSYSRSFAPPPQLLHRARSPVRPRPAHGPHYRQGGHGLPTGRQPHLRGLRRLLHHHHGRRGQCGGQRRLQRHQLDERARLLRGVWLRLPAGARSAGRGPQAAASRESPCVTPCCPSAVSLDACLRAPFLVSWARLQVHNATHAEWNYKAVAGGAFSDHLMLVQHTHGPRNATARHH
jgi:hypothetical protein